MKRILLIFVLIGISQFGFSQVGINTTSPNAQLEIKSTNQATPTNTDGILIPKIDAFPLTNPTAAQQGMMVYLTTLSAGKPPGFYYWDNTGTPQWKGFGGSGWELTGNSGTDPNVNFIGTTDANDVVFRRDNVISGKIGMANTSFGRSSMNPANSGIYNSTFGLSSMSSNTNGSSNSAFGNYALFSNTSGSSNTGIGTNTLYTNTIGQHNTALGSNSLEYNTQGDDNSSIGYYSLYKNTLGNNNTANGNESLYENLTGNNNTAIGFRAGKLATGDNNLTLGANADVPIIAGSHQMSIANVIYGAAMNDSSFARIGINEPAPKAKLQINASNQTTPDNTDGMIIPKIDAFPITDPTAAQNGMMVFLTTPANQAGFYYWDDTTTSWKGVADKTGWSLTGNEGTDPTINFIGTTDDVDVVFHRDFLEAGRLGYEDTSFGRGSLRYNTGVRNTAIGNGAMGGFITGFNSGDFNTAVGSSALSHNITGSSNSSFGSQSLINNNEGSSNVAFGDRALVSNTNASKNVAVGQTALFSQDFANGGVAYDTNNVAVGLESLYSNKPTTSTNGINNTAVGNESLRGNKTASDNTAIGFQALKNNSYGEKNVAIGKQALFSQNYANGNVNFETANTAIGYGALYNTNSTSNINGSSNIGIGKYALSNNATGNSNIAIGGSALGATWNAVGTMTGDRNVAIGGAAIKSLTAGSNNIALGGSSLSYNNIGNDNISIGVDALFYSTGLSGGTVIGTRAMQNYGISSPTGTNDNVAIGYESLRGTNTSAAYVQNTAIGYQTLTATTSGNGNTASGYKALTANTSGSFNTAFGDAALSVNTAGSGNVALGYQAGLNETGSNKLYIDNSSTTTPLIYGDFSTDRLRINGNEEVIKVQLTADGDDQNSLYALRNRDSQNDGTGYTIGATNNAIAARNLYGDLYTFGVAGYSDNDFSRSGGVFGGCFYLNTHWASLAYKSSASTPYGVYASATNTFASGAGRLIAPTRNQTEIGVGGGFYGGVIGSWSKGTIGSIAAGNIFASYNSGDEYTSGKQIEIVETEGNRTAAYTVTSTEVIVYKKGKVSLNNGSARVNFDANYTNLLGDIPAVTATPMGECNGLYIAAVDKSGFTIKEINNGSANVSVSWIAVGDRVDANSKTPLKEILDPNFDNNINEVMFNENNTSAKAKGIWSEGDKIHFGEIPKNHTGNQVKDIPDFKTKNK